ncbi:prolipoprotein diacylglyceryl transferase [Planococcus halotolerans]|uniref:Phosphatidylglycerol--prolipoprotein diacylglyceryl transferase n=1 Tax=Planococcus halotolerans TaxID=2233542 RepID=A0A365KND8_9BACL|nr:prolipoprotein diacylglyceryl transferase [Planococcus halotolerans]QHJ71880.1 prolipoprotein diacylglyceryl transferase [Planococcus halotolerans]RAZ74641.1 prolipoprotein diacylglyceryl transferase [Planococcus halotolerans]
MFSVLGSIDPVAFSLGPISVHWYGVIIATGIVIAFLVGQREMVKRGMHPEFLTDLLIWAVPLAIVGARIYYVIFEWDNYKDNPGEIIAIWNGGLAIHGALIMSVIVAYIFTKKRNTPFLKVADILAPSILIGQAIGRWGNFINQEAHGGEVSRAFLENLFIPDWIINHMYIDGAYYHPTFLYESLWSFVGIIILLLLRRVNLVRGEMFFFYMIWYSVGRYFIEGMRTDSLYVFGIEGLRTAQLVSILAIIIAVVLIIYRRVTIKNPPRYLDEPAEPKKKSNKKSKKK